MRRVCILTFCISKWYIHIRAMCAHCTVHFPMDLDYSRLMWTEDNINKFSCHLHLVCRGVLHACTVNLISMFMCCFTCHNRNGQLYTGDEWIECNKDTHRAERTQSIRFQFQRCSRFEKRRTSNNFSISRQKKSKSCEWRHATIRELEVCRQFRLWICN